MNEYSLQRGDIYYIDKYDGQIGSEQHSGRPGVIVSNDACNASSGTVEVVYLTTKVKKNLPTHVRVTSSRRDSTALCEQVTTVAVSRLGDHIGHCTDDEMARISDAIIISMALKDRCPRIMADELQKAVQKAPLTVIEDETTVTAKLRAERDTYKAMYEQLIDRVVGKI